MKLINFLPPEPYCIFGSPNGLEIEPRLGRSGKTIRMIVWETGDSNGEGMVFVKVGGCAGFRAPGEGARRNLKQCAAKCQVCKRTVIAESKK